MHSSIDSSFFDICGHAKESVRKIWSEGELSWVLDNNHNNNRQAQPTTIALVCFVSVVVLKTKQNLPVTHISSCSSFLKTIWNHPMVVVVIPKHVIYIGIMRRLERPTTKPMYHHQQTNHHNHINIILPQHQPPPLL